MLTCNNYVTLLRSNTSIANLNHYCLCYVTVMGSNWDLVVINCNMSYYNTATDMYKTHYMHNASAIFA